MSSDPYLPDNENWQNDYILAGDVYPWVTFDKDMSTFWEQARINHSKISLDKPIETNSSGAYAKCMYKEQIQHGIKSGVIGQFHDQIGLRVSEAIANLFSGQHVTFGNYSIVRYTTRKRYRDFSQNIPSENSTISVNSEPSDPFRKAPDVVVCADHGHRPLLVGEVLTPWDHNMDHFACLSTAKWKQMSTQEKCRKQLWQVANYMHSMGLRYGFLTTYEKTVFLKLEEVDPKSRSLKLLCSPIILRSSEPPCEQKHSRSQSNRGETLCKSSLSQRSPYESSLPISMPNCIISGNDVSEKRSIRFAATYALRQVMFSLVAECLLNEAECVIKYQSAELVRETFEKIEKKEAQLRRSYKESKHRPATKIGE